MATLKVILGAFHNMGVWSISYFHQREGLTSQSRSPVAMGISAKHKVTGEVGGRGKGIGFMVVERQGWLNPKQTPSNDRIITDMASWSGISTLTSERLGRPEPAARWTRPPHPSPIFHF